RYAGPNADGETVAEAVTHDVSAEPRGAHGKWASGASGSGGSKKVEGFLRSHGNEIETYTPLLSCWMMPDGTIYSTTKHPKDPFGEPHVTSARRALGLKQG